jgi:hypothetical protein
VGALPRCVDRANLIITECQSINISIINVPLNASHIASHLLCVPHGGGGGGGGRRPRRAARYVTLVERSVTLASDRVAHTVLARARRAPQAPAPAPPSPAARAPPPRARATPPSRAAPRPAAPRWAPCAQPFPSRYTQTALGGVGCAHLASLSSSGSRLSAVRVAAAGRWCGGGRPAASY